MAVPKGTIVDQNSDPTAVDLWALVLNGLVVQSIMASLTDVQSVYAPQYDYCVDTTVGGQSFNIGDAYNAGSDTFGLPVPSLADAKKENLTNFSLALEQYVQEFYSLETQFRLFIIYYLAQQNSLTNRVAYIQPLLTWVQNVITYSATYTSTVMAINDAATALNSQWDFTQIGVPPAVTLIGAISISN